MLGVQRGPWTWRVVSIVLVAALGAAAAVAYAMYEHRPGGFDSFGPRQHYDANVDFIASRLDKQMQRTHSLPDLSGLESRMLDEHGTDIRIMVEFGTVTVMSAGADKKFGTGDDCVRRVVPWTGSRPARR